MYGNTAYLIGGNGRTEEKKDEEIPVLGYQLFFIHSSYIHEISLAD